MKRTKPMIRWQGGKSRLLGELLPRIPAHNTYCELFAGGLALLLAKPASKCEVVNDLNGDLVALYRNVQRHLPAVLDELQWMLHSRKNLTDYIDQPGLTEIQRAAQWLIRNKTSFAAGMRTFAVQKTQGPPSISNSMDLIKGVHARLDRVTIENLSYERCLALYDSKDSFFFIDPPYLQATNSAYDGWTEEQMRGLRKVLNKAKGKWLVTVDDSEFNRELFSDCKLHAVVSQNQCTNQRTSRATFGELIITPQ